MAAPPVPRAEAAAAAPAADAGSRRADTDRVLDQGWAKVDGWMDGWMWSRGSEPGESAQLRFSCRARGEVGAGRQAVIVKVG